MWADWRYDNATLLGADRGAAYAAWKEGTGNWLVEKNTSSWHSLIGYPGLRMIGDYERRDLAIIRGAAVSTPAMAQISDIALQRGTGVCIYIHAGVYADGTCLAPSTAFDTRIYSTIPCPV
jgi:hypothetical protein